VDQNKQKRQASSRGKSPMINDKFISHSRRTLLKAVTLTGGLFGIRVAQAQNPDTTFPGEPTHHIVYQCNKADPEYLEHILFSAGAMLRKYVDDVEIVFTVFGAGLHLLAIHPQRHIPRELQQRASSLAVYGVSFHACGNTMQSLHWTEKDLVDYAKVVPIGADDLMQLQEKGFAYISW
jgi:intracellular sulfur oxidation DsrE/DsrF family protein